MGPVWQGGTHNEVASLRSAYDAALSLAAENNASSIALPLLSAGVYGFPVDISLSVAQNAIHDFLDSHDSEIRLVLFDHSALQAVFWHTTASRNISMMCTLISIPLPAKKTREADDEVIYAAALQPKRLVNLLASPNCSAHWMPLFPLLYFHLSMPEV